MKYILITGADSPFLSSFLNAQSTMPDCIVHVRPRGNVLNLFRNYLILIEGYIRKIVSFRGNSGTFCCDKLIKPRDLNSIANWLGSKHPDLLVVYKIGKLSEEMINSARFGAVNLHPSLLPKYRGGHPLHWMAMNYDLEGGCSLIKVNAQFDAGDIILQESFRIEPGQTEDDVESIAINTIGVRLVNDFLKSMQSDSGVSFNPQKEQSPTAFARRLSKEQAFELIDWINWPITRVWHYLRCNDFWLHKVHEEFSWTRQYSCSIGDCIMSRITGKPGDLCSDDDGIYFVHPEGKIPVQAKFSLKKWIKEVISGK